MKKQKPLIIYFIAARIFLEDPLGANDSRLQKDYTRSIFYPISKYHQPS